MNPTKNVSLSIIYVILFFLTILLFDFLMGFFLDYVLFKILDWFNNRGWLFQIIILILGGWGIFYFILHIFEMFITFLNTVIFIRFPINSFTKILSVIMIGINAIVNLIHLWHIFPKNGLGFIIELIVLSIFVLTVNICIITPQFSDRD